MSTHYISKRRRCLLMSAGLAVAARAGGVCAQITPPTIGLKPGEPLRVAFVYVGPVGEAGWNTQHDRGRREMEARLGAKVQTHFVEKVDEGADAERVIRDLAVQGFHLIFTTSFGYMNPTLKVAGEFPGTIFEHGSGYRSAPNMGNYNARFYEGRFLSGMIAGQQTRSNQAGYVGAFPIPEVLQGINAFTLGARSVNPKFETHVIWVNAWHDPVREREAAVTLAGQGADVLTHHTDSTATVQVAEERLVKAVAYHSDMRKFGPNAQLVAVTHQWGEYYTRVAQAVLDGRWKAESVWGGLREKMIRLEGFNQALPAKLVEAVRSREQAMTAGKAHAFSGPIRTNGGRLVIARGALSDQDLGAMDYYVEGVAGAVPKAPH